MIPSYASYRDPRSAIQEQGGEIVRRFDQTGSASFLEAHAGTVLSELVERGMIPPYTIASREPLEVRTPLIPFVSYPDEWTPQMLRDAGLLTLEVSQVAWKSGMHLRDATAYNIVFDGATPVFVDLGSFGGGHTNTWNAYGQFCDHFLSPLLIESHLGIPFRSVWTLEGVPLPVAAGLFRGASRFRRGVMTNVLLRARLESGHANDSLEQRKATRSELSLTPESIQHLMEKMHRILSSLTFSSDSTWGDYESHNSYDESQQSSRDDAIREFVRRAEVRGKSVDIGANAGRHSAILAEAFDEVVALDVDDVAVETHRKRLIATGNGGVFPLVGDIANPTPPRGFIGSERLGLVDRIAGFDAAIWMAVIHHLVVGKSIPLSGVAELAALISRRHLIEFVDPADPMVRLLSASKGGEHHEYTREAFVSAFSERFKVSEQSRPTPTRYIYEVSN
jgi:hypothetical protein